MNEYFFSGQMILTSVSSLRDNALKIGLVTRDMSLLTDENILFLNRNLNSEIQVGMKSETPIYADELTITKPENEKELSTKSAEKSRCFQVRNKYLFRLYNDKVKAGKISTMSSDEHYEWYYDHKIIPMIQADIEALNRIYE